VRPARSQPAAGGTSPVQENRRTWPGDADQGEIEILGEEVVWSNEVARLFNDRVRFPGGRAGEHREGMHFRLDHAESKDDGVVIVPITGDDGILLVRQFRHAVRMWMREIPRGARERGESIVDAAVRELREEIGRGASAVYPLGRIAPASSELTEYPYLFAARVTDQGESEPEATEAIDAVFAYTFAELKRACQVGEIVDSFTLAAVTRLEPHFDGLRFVYRRDAAPPANDGSE
jgi:ADP-ribose pyrophosphatase